MPWWKVGNKYVDSLDDDYEDMNEAISAFRYLSIFEWKFMHIFFFTGARVANPCGAKNYYFLCGLTLIHLEKDTSCFIRLTADLPEIQV